MNNGIKRRILLMTSAIGGGFEIPTFTGNHAIFGDEKQGYIECYSSGDLTFNSNGTVDIFILGSGLKGATGTADGTGTTATGSGEATGGNGGNGAKGTTIASYNVEKGSYTITVAATCTSVSTANASSAFGQNINTVNSNGGKGGYGTASWTEYNVDTMNSTEGAAGSNGTSIPFSVTSGTFYKLLGAGGGGGGGRAGGFAYKGGYAGGTLGGGHGGRYASGSQTECIAGTANTGSGGGGGGAAAYGSSLYKFSGGAGGSGIVIIRWGY